MTIEELQQDSIKRRKEVLDAITGEFEEFGITSKPDVSKNCEVLYYRVLIGPFFFDFRIDLIKDEIVLYAYTHKTLLNKSGVGIYPLTMSNIDELLMGIKSFENVYVPQFSK